jgi:class 3 adenylate cyclase
MNYDAFEPTYQTTQIERIIKGLGDMRQRTSSPGREIPDTDSLVIGEGRRLTMAVLFLDVCKFSARLSNSEEEQNDILSTFNLFFTEMVRILEDYGGTVEKNTGDGLMAYFEDGGGDPPETGSKRALAASLTMFRTSAQLLNPLLEKSAKQRVDFRVAIDYGPVTIAKLGAPRRFNSCVAIGTAANIAYKMLRFAGPNEIVIGDQLRQQLQYPPWILFEEKLPDNSGWIYLHTGFAYPFHKYTGRWTR